MQTAGRLPSLLSLPLRFVPNAVHSTSAALMLNRTMASPMAEGELEFLRERVVAIRVEDAFIDLRLRLGPKGFAPVSARHEPDVTIAGNTYDFLVLAARKEDPDTLFFNRRLRIIGETALGLQLKNLLDSFEFALPDLSPRMHRLLEQGVGIYERLFVTRAKGESH